MGKVLPTIIGVALRLDTQELPGEVLNRILNFVIISFDNDSLMLVFRAYFDRHVFFECEKWLLSHRIIKLSLPHNSCHM